MFPLAARDSFDIKFKDPKKCTKKDKEVELLKKIKVVIERWVVFSGMRLGIRILKTWSLKQMGASHTRTYTEKETKTNNEPTKDGGLENRILFESSDFRFQFATFFGENTHVRK